MDGPQTERPRETERENRVGNGFGYFGNQDRLILHFLPVFNTLAYAGWLVSLAGALQFMHIFVYLPVCNSVLLSLHDAQATSPNWGRLVRVFGLIGWPEDCHSTICNPPSVLCCPESIIQPINCVSGYSLRVFYSPFLKLPSFCMNLFKCMGGTQKKACMLESKWSVEKYPISNHGQLDFIHGYPRRPLRPGPTITGT